MQSAFGGEAVPTILEHRRIVDILFSDTSAVSMVRDGLAEGGFPLIDRARQEHSKEPSGHPMTMIRLRPGEETAGT